MNFFVLLGFLFVMCLINCLIFLIFFWLFGNFFWSFILVNWLLKVLMMKFKIFFNIFICIVMLFLYFFCLFLYFFCFVIFKLLNFFFVRFLKLVFLKVLLSFKFNFEFWIVLNKVIIGFVKYFWYCGFFVFVNFVINLIDVCFIIKFLFFF